jgi:hypothetical protein
MSLLSRSFFHLTRKSRRSVTQIRTYNNYTVPQYIESHEPGLSHKIPIISYTKEPEPTGFHCCCKPLNPSSQQIYPHSFDDCNCTRKIIYDDITSCCCLASKK